MADISSSLSLDDIEMTTNLTDTPLSPPSVHNQYGTAAIIDKPAAGIVQLQQTAHISGAYSGTVRLLVLLLGFYLLSRTWQSITRRRRFIQASKKKGCQVPPVYQNLDPVLGLDLLFRIGKADLKGDRSLFYKQLHQAHGKTFQMRLCGSTQIQSAQHQNILAVATTDFDSFGVEPLRGRVGVPFCDKGVFLADGPVWKHSRALLKPIFNHSEIADLKNFEKHVVRFLDLLPRDGSTFDIQPLAKRLFLDAATDCIFGESTDSLLPNPPAEVTEFMKACDASVLGVGLRFMAGHLKPLFALDPTWKKHYTKVHKFIDARVAAALERQRIIEETHKLSVANPLEGRRMLEPSNVANPTKFVLIDHLVKDLKDPFKLRNELINIFFPARDGAGLAFSNVMFELVRNPQYWTAIRAEADSLSRAGKKLTFDVLKSLKMTKAVVNETLRLHLTSSKVSRVALRDTVLPVGGGPDNSSPLFVPRGTTVELNMHVIQRDPEIWGPDAEEFRPERWLDPSRPNYEGKAQYAPFWAGVRICPAQQQVHTQIAYLLLRMATDIVSIRNEDSELAYKEFITMTIQSRNGVKMSLTHV